MHSVSDCVHSFSPTAGLFIRYACKGPPTGISPPNPISLLESAPRHPWTMNAESSRICPFCAESINPAAKLCPRCRQWLTMRSLRNPAIFLWVHGGLSAAVFILMGFGFLSAVNRLGNPKPYYTAFPQVLRVVESRMNWARTKDGPRIYLTGILTNQSPVAWGGTPGINRRAWIKPLHQPARLVGIVALSDVLLDERYRARSEERRVGKECRSRWS